jgi:hypothetical protein
VGTASQATQQQKHPTKPVVVTESYHQEDRYKLKNIAGRTIHFSFKNQHFTQLQHLGKTQTHTPEPIIIS